MAGSIKNIFTILSDAGAIKALFALVLALASVINYDSDASSCGVTYYFHSDDSTGVIYNHNMFMVQATGLKVSSSSLILLPLKIGKPLYPDLILQLRL